MKATIDGVIQNGRIKYSPDVLAALTTNFNDGAVTIEVSQNRKGVSDRQRGYWFGCLVKWVVLQEHEAGRLLWPTPFGNLPCDDDRVDRDLKDLFAPRFIDPKTLKKTKKTLRTMDIDHFTWLLEGVNEWCFERYNSYPPPPDKYWALHLTEKTT